MKRILMAFAEPFEFGGQEAFALNMYKNINHRDYSVDFFTPYNVSNKTALEELNKNNNQIFYFNKKFDSILRKIYFRYYLKKFIKQHKDYDVVHLNSGSTFALAEGAKICKKNGIRQVIVHSHATGYSSLKHKVTNFLLSNKFKYADTFLACSDNAAEFRFPKRVINSKQYIVLKNGIDIKSFKYDEDVRKEYRKKLNINSDNIVIGNVGRLSGEKNQKFIIDVFEKLLKKEEKCKLIIVGNGILENEIIDYVKNKKLEEKFILLKDRDDVNKILQAMDIFVFPSLFEGLGIAAVEAQASGLPTFCSENIPEDVNITPLFKKIELSNLELWVKEIEKIKKYDREDFSEFIDNSGFNIKNTAKNLQNIYTNAKRGEENDKEIKQNTYK